jgi:hypothetical protein
VRRGGTANGGCGQLSAKQQCVVSGTTCGLKYGELAMSKITRRQVFGSLGLSAGMGILSGCDGTVNAFSERENKAGGWTYSRLEPKAVAAEAYQMMPKGGCMYGVFGSILNSLAGIVGEPFRSFPVEMMKYGAGGVGGFGSLCGTLNGGAALLGLFVQDGKRRDKLITELFTWYESTELPVYGPKERSKELDMPKSVAGSVLCHISVGRWCRVSGYDVLSGEMHERCSRLTADVAAKTVELLNRSLDPSSTFAGLPSETKSCASCHGQRELRDAMGTMSCGVCHKMPKKHP